MKHNQTRWYTVLSLIQNRSTTEFGYVEERTYNGPGTDLLLRKFTPHPDSVEGVDEIDRVFSNGHE